MTAAGRCVVGLRQMLGECDGARCWRQMLGECDGRVRWRCDEQCMWVSVHAQCMSKDLVRLFLPAPTLESRVQICTTQLTSTQHT